MFRRVSLPVRASLLLLPLVAVANLASAQPKRLSLDAIYDPVAKVNFSGKTVAGLAWLNDSQYLWAREVASDQGGGFDQLKVDAVSGRTEPLFDAAKMQAALARLPGVAQDEARRLAHQRSYAMNPIHSAAVLTIASDLYYYEFGADHALRLTATPGDEESASFSPDGRTVAFVRGANLYAVDAATGREQALTSSGGAQLSNGKLDWVYEEEIYGRGLKRAYWWSPDSASIAFLELNEMPVPEFTLEDHIPYRLAIETWDYPKAGDPNPTVRLGIVRLAGGEPRFVDTGKYATGEHLVVAVDWAPNSKEVVYEVQNREQTWLDLNLGDAATLATRTIFRESSKFWVNPKDGATPTWLKDGSFLWLSERTGWSHLFRFKTDGTLVRQITDGRWELRTLHGVDEMNGWVYFSGTERSHIGSDVYRVRLDGGDVQRLSKAEGTHRAEFNSAFTLFLDSWSNVTTPTQVRLHKAADGAEARVVEANAVAALAEYGLSKPDFLQVKTRDGFVMEAMMIKPPDFDPARRYPVYQFTYSGPHAPQVKNAWGGPQYLYHQLLAQQGIIVWVIDNRTASGKGVESTFPVFHNFGELELKDLEEGLAWLKQQPYVDGSRVALHGWSYGGFMTSYAMTHSTAWAFGIAGGTVTDWRDYDSVYTERYMGMPQNNPDGYRKSSPRFAAANLQGKLLLIHGTMDDNVHMQNTIQFVYELQKAGKSFQLMLYPKSRHGVSDPALVRHLRQTMYDFIIENLKPQGAARTTAAR